MKYLLLIVLFFSQSCEKEKLLSMQETQELVIARFIAMPIISKASCVLWINGLGTHYYGVVITDAGKFKILVDRRNGNITWVE